MPRVNHTKVDVAVVQLKDLIFTSKEGFVCSILATIVSMDRCDWVALLERGRCRSEAKP